MNDWTAYGRKWGASPTAYDLGIVGGAAEYGGTDKETGHQYMATYQKILGNLEIKNVLEIGIWKNGGSLQMWSEIWPDAYIHGIDIDPDCWKSDKENITVDVGDATDPDFMFGIIEKYAPFDVVIDDGSHIYEHVEASFSLLYPHITQYYIIEDLIYGVGVQRMVAKWKGVYHRTPVDGEGLIVVKANERYNGSH